MRFVLLAALLVSTPSIAADMKTPSGAEETTSNGSAEPQEKEEKKVCKRIAATESRMAAKRICMTAADWKKQQSDEDR